MREMLFERSEFIYRHGMEQIFSDFILSPVSFGTFLASRKVQRHDFFCNFSYVKKS